MRVALTLKILDFSHDQENKMGGVQKLTEVLLPLCGNKSQKMGKCVWPDDALSMSLGVLTAILKIPIAWGDWQDLSRSRLMSLVNNAHIE